ncbi:hypothetical protein H4R21_001329 [Coemansia helicoidea]|uniref:Uncharacterized protein n=1 Tax=Coemansia helicoidea TaxID=1286919 RepID=A0ACC1LCF6_9FUNG|nr:hypothetical protein H4R21_001329 [Coemansia helicoidea]
MLTPAELVEELTTAGGDAPDTQQLRALKALCRDDHSGCALQAAFGALLAALGKRHAQVRVAALQVVHELFCRSHGFRALVVGQLSQLFKLAFGAYGARLPPPVQHATRLQRLAAEYYYAWVERYGAAYQRLVYGFRYLRFVELVDFKDAVRAYRHNAPERVRRRQQTHADNRRECMRRLLVAVRADIAAMRQQIVASLDALERCFAILMPDIADMFGGHASEDPPKERAGGDEGDDSNDWGDSDDDLDAVLAVMAANRQAIEVSIDPDRVLETEETASNAAVFDAIRDQVQLFAQMYRPRIDTWLAKLARVDPDVDPEAQQLLESVRGLRDRMDVAWAKCRDLGVGALPLRRRQDVGASDEDDDFEDVPDTHDHGPVPVRPLLPKTSGKPAKRNAVFSLLGEPVIAGDPTYVDPSVLRTSRAGPARTQHTANSTPQGELSAVEERLRESAPVVSYGPDLLYWGQTEISANTTGLEVRHRFLGSARDEPVLSDAARRGLQMRAVFLPEPARGPIKACRAPLKDGRLCPRRDLAKCPFHGPIVPRDEQGRPAHGPAPPEFADAAATAAADDAPPRVSSVATAETPADLQWQDLEDLVSKKHGAPARRRPGPAAKPKRPRSTLDSTRKPAASGADRLRQITSRRRK